MTFSGKSFLLVLLYHATNFLLSGSEICFCCASLTITILFLGGIFYWNLTLHIFLVVFLLYVFFFMPRPKIYFAAGSTICFASGKIRLLASPAMGEVKPRFAFYLRDIVYFF